MNINSGLPLKRNLIIMGKNKEKGVDSNIIAIKTFYTADDIKNINVEDLIITTNTNKLPAKKFQKMSIYHIIF